MQLGNEEWKNPTCEKMAKNSETRKGFDRSSVCTTKMSYQKRLFERPPEGSQPVPTSLSSPLPHLPLSPHSSPWRCFLTAQPCGKGTHSTCSGGSLPCPPQTGLASRAAPFSSSHTWFSAMAAYCSLLESFKNVNAQPSP